MKKLFLLLVTGFVYTCACAQVQLIARSNYGYDGTQYTISDSFKNFFAAANTTTITQNLTDGYVWGSEDSSHYLYWNTVTQLFELNTRFYNTYDPTYTQYWLGVTINFVNNIPTTIDSSVNTFNANLLDHQLYNHTTLAGPVTIPYQKVYFHYNAGNYCDTAWYVNFSAGNYNNTKKTYYTYDVNNRIDEAVNFQSNDSVNYTASTKSHYYYNATGYTDSILLYSWQAGNWYKIKNTVYTYNANNMATRIEDFSFNNLTQLYAPSNLREYIRNNGTLPDSMFNAGWNITTLKYDTANKAGYVYTNGVLVRNYYYNFNTATQAWEPAAYYGRQHYYYNMLPNSISEYQAQSRKLDLFPNPALDQLSAAGLKAGTGYEIYSMDGKRVLQGTVGPDLKINIHALTTGVYSLYLLEGNQGRYGQFIRQ